jgi:hypothetical protein
MPEDSKIVSLRPDTTEAPAPKREAPQKQSERLAAIASASEKAGRSQRRPWARWALFALPPLGVTVCSCWYVTGGQVTSIAGVYAQVETLGISTDVSAIVQRVEVTDNRRNDPAQVLYRLDPRLINPPFGVIVTNVPSIALGKYLATPTMATFSGPVTRTAIMSAAGRFFGPTPASNPFATISIDASPTWSSR